MKLLLCQLNFGALLIDKCLCIVETHIYGEMKMKCIRYLISLAVAIGLTGCALRQTHAEPRVGAMASVGIVNHTDQYIYSASVNGASGGNMSAWGVGNASVCCTTIPRVWYPQMKVRVRWNMPIGVKDVIKEKIVEVEKYSEAGDIYMHFFPNDEVRVIVSGDGPGAPNYPILHSGKPKDTTSSK